MDCTYIALFNLSKNQRLYNSSDSPWHTHDADLAIRGKFGIQCLAPLLNYQGCDSCTTSSTLLGHSHMINKLFFFFLCVYLGFKFLLLKLTIESVKQTSVVFIWFLTSSNELLNLLSGPVFGFSNRKHFTERYRQHNSCKLKEEKAINNVTG